MSEARQQLAAIIDRARSEHSPVYLAAAAIASRAVIDADDLDELIALADDMADIRAAAAAGAEMARNWAGPHPLGAGQGRPRPYVTYRITLSPDAQRQLRKSDPPTRRRIQAALELLAQEPRPPAATQLVGGTGEWKVRIGDCRIVYSIDDADLLVLVLLLGHRREIYRPS